MVTQLTFIPYSKFMFLKMDSKVERTRGYIKSFLRSRGEIILLKWNSFVVFYKYLSILFSFIKEKPESNDHISISNFTQCCFKTLFPFFFLKLFLQTQGKSTATEYMNFSIERQHDPAETELCI